MSPPLGPKPRLGYAASRLERDASRRADPDLLTRAQHDNSARVYVIAGEFVLLKRLAESYDPLLTIPEAAALGPARETAFLGLDGSAPRFAAGLDAATMTGLKERDELLVVDLRTLAARGLVGAEHLPPLAEGKSLLNWHARHRFCPNCGHATQVTEGGWRRDCPACGVQHFPRTDPVAIMLAVDGERCLLGRSHRFAPGMWSCLAGYIEPGETVEEAARREIREEAGIVCGRVRYFASQPWPFPSSLMIGCHAEALSQEVLVDRTELDDARWFTRADAALMLARRHPQEFTGPLPLAIAYHIIRAWVEDGVAFA